MTTVIKICPTCRRMHKISVDSEKLIAYQSGKGFVQDLFSELDDFEREFLKSGLCPNCQESLFGKPYKGNLIKEG